MSRARLIFLFLVSCLLPLASCLLSGGRQHSVTASSKRCQLPRTDGRRRASPPDTPTWTVRAVFHRALGALQLLLDDGDPLALHERGAALQRRTRGAGVRPLSGR